METKEFTLTIEHVHYPYTAVHILEILELILKEWNIRDKVYTITTDNSSNIKKAIDDMREVKWLGCAVHTLHLVVEKEMIPAQILIIRAKRLIDFLCVLNKVNTLKRFKNNFQILKIMTKKMKM